MLSATVSASRLPTVDGDDDAWGTILNDFLNVSHNESGELRNDTVSTLQIVNGTITDVDISDTTNLTLGEKITFTLGEIIDNIVDGWITITGGLNVTQNLNVVGNATISGNLTVSQNVTADWFKGNLNWSDVQNAPAYIENNTAGWNLTFSNIYSTDWTNISITESQISNLQSYIANGSNINVLDVNASSATIHGDLNVTGTSYLGDITITADNITTNGVVSKDGNISFYNNTGSEMMRITNDGKVGIGNNTPQGNLHITEGAGILPTIASNYDDIIVQNNDDSSDDVGITLIGGSSAECAIDFGDNESSTDGEIRYSHQTLSMTFDTADATRLTINGVGDTGIGTVPVSATRLAIRAKNTDDILNILETGGDEVFTVLESGNVGIGETTPQSSLVVAGDLNVTGTSYLGDITISADNITTNGVVSKDGNISFYNNTGSEMVRITNDGKVGIGTSSPEVNLHISGESDSTGILLDIDATTHATSNRAAAIFGDWIVGQDSGENGAKDFFFWQPTVGFSLVIQNGSGNVGIGTTTPTHELNVVGDINATGDLIANKVYSLSGSGSLSDSDSTTETVTLTASAAYILTTKLKGGNTDHHKTHVVHVPLGSNLNVGFAELLTSDWDQGSITVATQDGNAQWGVNNNANYQIKITFATGTNAADWAYNFMRMI